MIAEHLRQMLEATSSSTYNRPRLKISAKWKRTWSFPVSNLISPNVMLCSHELISLMLMASLALVAALPVDSDSGAVSAEGVREERARKESGKLRLMEAIVNSRSSSTNIKEKQSTMSQPVKEETKVIVTKSESTNASKTTTPKSEESMKMERQRSIADQALRDRLRHSTKVNQKDQASRGSSPVPKMILAASETAQSGSKVNPGSPPSGPAAVPPVVYVPVTGPQAGGNKIPLRFAPYVPATYPSYNPTLSPNRRISWPFGNLFPIIINDPYVSLIGGYGGVFEYGPEADVCKPSRDAGKLEKEETEIAMEADGYYTKLTVKGGGVAIAGPGGVATAGRGGTAIVGPGGVAYTSPGGLAVVGPGGKVVAKRKKVEVNGQWVEDEASDKAKGLDGVIVARGPVVYYDSSEDKK